LAAEKQETKPSDTGGSDPQRFVRQLSDVLDLPFVLVGSVVVGAGAGYMADKWLHTSPVFTLVLGGMGFAGGIFEVIRRVTARGRNSGR
jgi:F0F1-type ATP synthase assembly protein I